MRDAVIAQSIAQSRRFWALRENISEAQAAEGKNVKHDISVPISAIGDFVEATDAALAARFPGIRMVVFGHLGDGNLHYNVSPPEGADGDSLLADQDAINALVHDAVAAARGSISAEHGIGIAKVDWLGLIRSDADRAAAAAVRSALDPDRVMNPGVLAPAE